MFNVVIYNSEKKSGHHPEHITQLLRAVKNSGDSNKKFTFILHPSMAEFVQDCILDTVDIVFIDITLIREWEQMGKLRRSFAEMEYITSFLKENNAVEIIFLMLDIYQFALFFYRRSLSTVKISGVFFKPFLRYVPASDSPALFKAGKIFLFRTYKRGLLHAMLLNKSIETIYVLNDKYSTQKFNSIFRTDRFQYLPDPVICNTNSTSKFGNLKSFQKPIFLVFGSITESKNIENILDSFSYMKNPVCSLLIVGKWESDRYKAAVENKISKLAIKNNKVQVKVVDEYISEKDISVYIGMSDIVLIPYKGFYYSSGVLGLAACQEKPVLGSDVGLVSELIEDYDLGVNVDPNSPKDIARGIESLLLSISLDCISPKNNLYIRERSYKQFVDRLLQH